MNIILLALLGLSAGSFAYALTLRMNDGRDWVRGRSECESCHHALQFYDLIPLLSWLSTSGKCRYCRKKLSYEYPAVELLTSLAFAGSYYFWPYGFTKFGVVIFSFWLIMLTLLVSLVIFDLKWFLLPDKLVYTLISLAGASKLVQVFYFQDFQRVIGIAGGIVVGFGVFFALSYFSKGKYIGDGDVKYGLFFGILLGSPFKALLVISLGSLLGTLLTLPSLLTHKKKLTSVIPYGPSLIVATIVLYIFGDRIIDLLTTTYLFP